MEDGLSWVTLQLTSAYKGDLNLDLLMQRDFFPFSSPLVCGSLNIINGLLQLITFLTILCWVRKWVNDGALFMEITLARVLRGVCGFFTLIWFITGSVYVFR